MKYIFVLIAAVTIFFAVCSGKSLMKDNEKAEGDDSIGDKVCDMCVDLITKATDQIIEHEDDFKQNGGKICHVVTLKNEELDKKCQEIVKDKVDQIISLVREKTAPKDVCVAISVCSAQ